MYKFEYASESLRQILSDQDTFWDPELQQELQPVLRQLKETGEPNSCGGADFGCKIGVSEIVYELKGKAFKLVYATFSAIKVVKFYEFHQMSHSIDWEAALDVLENKNQKEYSIPQIGDPKKFLEAIDAVHQGVVTPRDLGIKMGSLAKKDKDKARRGYYYGDFLEELDLLEVVKTSSRIPCIYKLTVKGELIAKTADSSTKSRLFAEALLGFPPLQIIITTTTRGEQQLTSELIEQIIHQTTEDGCGGTTKPRRAGSLRSLVNWVSRMAGIPICRKGQEGVQLYIPYIYAD